MIQGGAGDASIILSIIGRSEHRELCWHNRDFGRLVKNMFCVIALFLVRTSKSEENIWLSKVLNFPVESVLYKI